MPKQETEFADGLFVKAPHANAPDYVKAKLSMRREEMIAWLQAREGDWVNFDIKVSNGGKWYAAVDNWKPSDGEHPNHVAQTAPEQAPIEDIEVDAIDM